MAEPLSSLFFVTGNVDYAGERHAANSRKSRERESQNRVSEDGIEPPTGGS